MKTKTVEVIPDDIESIVEDAKEVEDSLTDVVSKAFDIEPLELYLYRDIHYNVMLVRGSRVIYVSYDDYVKLLDLLKVLENRIEIREKQIDDVIDIHKRHTSGELYLP